MPVLSYSDVSNPNASLLTVVTSRYAFEGRAAQAVRRLKYGRATSLAAPMAADLRETYDEAVIDPFDVIVPVPISATRRRQRGFNQSELLVEAQPPELVNPLALSRIRHTAPQVSLPADARLTNLRGAFAADPCVNGRAVLLVDDVVTTGGTATACAEALLESGATFVGLLTYCRAVFGRDHISGDRSP